MTARQLMTIGAFFAGLGVIFGAFGAHALETAVADWGLDAPEQAEQLDTWDVAVRYQMYHALGLLAVGLLAMRSASRTLTAAGVLFVLGILIFSGCLYALVLTGVTILGAIVPLGGLCMIAGWAVLAWATFQLGGTKQS